MVNIDEKEITRLLEVINISILEKKGENIINLNMKKIDNAIAKYFVICTANSNTQATTIADYVEYQTRCTLKERPWKKEGFENCEWILLDYVDIVVHIFQPKSREFYKLADLWADAETTVITEDLIK